MKARKCNRYWKVSVFDEKLGAFIVQCVCAPSERDAQIVADAWTESGFITRVSPHLADRRFKEPWSK